MYELSNNRILEEIFDNTVDEINNYYFNLFDPEYVIDSEDDKYLFYSKNYDEKFGHISLLNSKNKRVKVTYITDDGLTGYYKHLDDKELVGITKKQLDKAVAKQIEPFKIKTWNNTISKYNIESVMLKDFKKIEKIKKSSITQIHELISSKKFNDKILIMSDNAAKFIYHHKKEINYPLFSLNQKTADNLISGYNKLKSGEPYKSMEITITIQKAIEAA